MHQRSLRIRSIKKSALDFSYILVCGFIILGVVKAGQDLIKRIRPVEAVQAVSKQMIEVPVEKEVYKERLVLVTDEAQPVDIYVGEAVDTFFKGNQASEMRMIMHCLLNRESHHSENIAQGDGGMAGGPMQFWEDTYTRMRNNMITDGYATEFGSRENMKDSIDTATYAIWKGWGLEWGPILRSWNGVDRADCPIPSFYKE